MAAADVTDSDRAQLAYALGIAPADVPGALERIAAAATEEYLDMILGRRLPRRLEEIREQRLVLLVRHLFANHLPTEEQVARVFQLTPQQSRALLRGVMAKHRYELADAVRATLEGTLHRAQHEPGAGVWEVTADPATIDIINAELAAVDGSLPQVTRRRGP
ncbi:hypothetical protein ACFQX7_14855 [Luedemannella flava]